MQSTEIPDLLLAVWKRWRNESPAARGQVTQEQYWVLRTLNRSGPQRLKDLAASLGITPSSASIVVKRLKRDGFVVRNRGKEDEREVRVSLTQKGSGQLDAWRRAQLSRLSALFEGLTSEERSQLERLLRKAVGEKELGV